MRAIFTVKSTIVIAFFSFSSFNRTSKLSPYPWELLYPAGDISTARLASHFPAKQRRGIVVKSSNHYLPVLPSAYRIANRRSCKPIDKVEDSFLQMICVLPLLHWPVHDLPGPPENQCIPGASILPNGTAMKKLSWHIGAFARIAFQSYPQGFGQSPGRTTTVPSTGTILPSKRACRIYIFDEFDDAGS